MNTYIRLSAFALISISCSFAEAASLRFPRPNVIPEPVKLVHQAGEVCTFDDTSKVRVIARDKAAADWVRAKTTALLKVSPEVTFTPATGAALGEDAYRLKTAGNAVTIEADGLAGARNAFYTLRMCLMAERGKLTTGKWICPAIDVEDRPLHRFRAIHVCWLPETEARTIERQIRLAAYFKLNYMILEFWGTYDSVAYPWFGWEKPIRASKAELRRLVALGRDLGITLIPALNCFGHASMARSCGGKHATLDMCPQYASLFEPRAGWVWCLTNPETQKVIKTLIEEMYEDFARPGFFHIGCDESQPPSCPVCSATDWPVTVANHIKGVRDHIAGLGARTLMWHDMLLSKKDARWQGEDFASYPINGSSQENCERLLALLPKDVVICDWYYGWTKNLRTKFPTWDYFKAKGFNVVPTSWMQPEATKAMGIAAATQNTFGFMGTCWHHSYNAELYLIYLPTAEAAWGSSARANADKDAFRQQPADFASRWRQVGWDMGDMDRKTRCGYSEDEIPRHTTTPW